MKKYLVTSKKNSISSEVKRSISMNYLFYFLIVCFSLFQLSFNAVGQTSKEKMAIMEKEFIPVHFDDINIRFTGMSWDQAGDLMFEKNGKQYWLAPFQSNIEPIDEYYRIFELKLEEGYAKEVTFEMLGGYYKNTGFTPPIHYEDIDNDGIKDILIFASDEKTYKSPPWDGYNVFFKGTANGFIKVEISGITDDLGYHHAHDVDDFDNDGDIDIAFQGYGLKIFQNDGKGNFTKTEINNYERQNFTIVPAPIYYYIDAPFGLKFLTSSISKNKQLLHPSANQMLILDFINNKWEPKFFGKTDAFKWKPNVHIGPEQVLEFKNTLTGNPDLIYRVTTFDTVPGSTQGHWLTKFFRNSPTKFDTIYPMKNNFLDSTYTFFNDPKVADLNFDGYDDIFFKEDEFWGNTGQKLHPINERIWINDKKNNFNPLKFKFAEETRDLVYLLVKADSIKRINILMSQRRLPFKNEKGIYIDSLRVLYNRIDSIAYPKKESIEVSLCKNSTVTTELTNVPVRFKLKSGSNANINFSKTAITYNADKVGVDTIFYNIGNDFFTSENYRIIYKVAPSPDKPTITKDATENLVSSATYKNQWYKDGVILSDTTQIIKPTASGLYSVKTTLKGCSSEISSSFIYIKTSANELKSGEFVNIYPNPADDNFLVDFNLENPSVLDLYFYDLNGKLLFVKDKLKNGSSINLKHYSPGTYLVVIKNSKGDIVYSNKLIKY